MITISYPRIAESCEDEENGTSVFSTVFENAENRRKMCLHCTGWSTFGSSKAHKAIRKELVEENCLEAVISMPSGVFKPYAGVSTAILIFTKTGHGGTDKVWFYDMKADGFSLDDKRNPIDENDIPDIIERFRNRDQETERKRTEQSFFVEKKDIVDNEYDLSINKYKEVEYVPVEYPSTQEIMANLHELEMEITKSLAELDEMLEKDDKE